MHIRKRKVILLALSLFLFGAAQLSERVCDRRGSVATEAKRLERFLAARREGLMELLADTARTERLIAGTADRAEFVSMLQRPFGFFLYRNTDYGTYRMHFWNQQQAIPPVDLLTAPDGEYFLQLPNGYYYIVRKALGPATIAIGLVLVRSQFFINTDYLPQVFSHSRRAEERVVISRDRTPYPVRSVSGAPLFYLKRRGAGAVESSSSITLFFNFMGLLFLFTFIHRLAGAVARSRGVQRGLGVLGLSLFLLRLFTYLFPEWLNLRQFAWFDPVWYAADPVNRSLGDLLLNTLLSAWIIWFAWVRLQGREDLIRLVARPWRWAVAGGALFLLVFSSFTLASMVRSLVADSKISFDVTDFFGLSGFTVTGFIVLAAASLTFYYLSRLLFRFLFPLFPGRGHIVYFLIAFTGLLWLTVRFARIDVSFQLPVLLWLLGFTFLNSRQGSFLARFRLRIAGMLTWIFIFSLSITWIIMRESRRVEWERQVRMAEKLSVQTDPSSETLMSIAIQYLDNDFLSDQFRRFRDPVQGQVLRDSILTENYSGYLNKYDTRLYVFDAGGRPVNNEDAVSYQDLEAILEVQAQPTAIEGLYYYAASYDSYNYITRREVIDTTLTKLGTFFIVSNPKRYSREALFPELFRQFRRKGDPESSPVYSYAVYISDSLVSQPGSYPFATWLAPDERPGEAIERREKEGQEELWYRAGLNKVIVIARTNDTFLTAITLFSYLFCAFLLLVALLHTGGLLLSGLPRVRLIRLNIRSQVHGTILFISVFSFLVIGAATISFFISRYNRNNHEKLGRTMKIMVNEMEKKLTDLSVFDDVLTIYDSVSLGPLQQLVDEVADIHGVDVNVYDLNGDLQVSSEANVYTKGVLSRKMDPEAFYHLRRLRQVQFAHTERIGRFSFLSIYAPFRDERRQVYAYVNIPYFTSRPELEQEISNFLVTLINLNAFIFLVAGLIALLVTNRIVRSFALISAKMKEVSLGGLNEPIAWNREDEIGALVTEYNKMVAKLAERAEALARSEREAAWREMARQVAHEIKNPLTPMKLSIQYLQKAIDTNQPDVPALSARVARTLVEQIDHLARIAADFSQFAHIGQTDPVRFDLHEVLGSLQELYRADSRVSIRWDPVAGPVPVWADRTQLNRLFANLLSNAVQAQRSGLPCEIIISEERRGDRIQVRVRDNGVGIPDTQRNRIFTPNFTTKSSGTGLGLAMCKGIAEQAGGTIGFESVPGDGTTFIVELPLVV